MEPLILFAILYVLLSIIFGIATTLYVMLVGGVDFGTIWVFLAKAAILVGLVSFVMLLPRGSGWLALLVWWGGVMYLFEMDYWEARIMALFIWGLTIATRFGLIAFLNSAQASVTP